MKILYHDKALNIFWQVVIPIIMVVSFVLLGYSLINNYWLDETFEGKSFELNEIIDYFEEDYMHDMDDDEHWKTCL